MKLTIDQIYAITNGGAIKRLMQINMPVSLALEVAESLDRLDELVRQAENVRVGLVKRMQVDGRIPAENADEFNHQVALLFAEVKEVDFPKLDRKMLDSLGEITPGEAKGFRLLIQPDKPQKTERGPRGKKNDITLPSPVSYAETEP